MNKKLFFWCLYDFANSFVLMGFLFYFSQWLVVDHGKPAWWYNMALLASSVLFIITAPIVSKKIDATKKKITGLRFWTFLAFISYVVVAIITTLTEGLELTATIFYILANYTYLVCFLYFTPMLNDLSSNRDRSWKSGIGQSANSIGQVAGILAVLPFVNGITLFGVPGRAQALLPATILFGLFALPMLIFYREKPEELPTGGQATTQPNLITLFKEVFSYRPLALVLFTYFLFSDALLTFANNFPLYLEVVHKTTDTVKSVLTASILILAAVGAAVFGKVADKMGNARVLKIILVLWCFIILSMGLVTNFKILIPVFLFAGILFGPIWGISRALVGELSPPHLVASSYSYYVVAERFATFVGPAVWSIALITFREGVRGYQTGLFSLMILLIVGLFVLNKVEG